MNHTLGIDIGTFESKGVITDASGKVVATASTPHEMIVPQPGWAEHRAEEDWWGDFVTLSRRLLAESGVAPSTIEAVACSAIGPCMLPVDAEGTPLMNAVLYGVDNRAATEVAELTASIGEATLLARCGNALTSQSVGPKILWLKNARPEIFARTARVLTSTSFLVERLTGESVIDHYTAANFSPLYDIAKQDWIDDLAPEILPLDRLPRLMWSTEIAGRVSPAAAAATGLKAGTPVTAGTIDAAAEAASVGVREPGDMMLMYGSTVLHRRLRGRGGGAALIDRGNGALAEELVGDLASGLDLAGLAALLAQSGHADLGHGAAPCRIDGEQPTKSWADFGDLDVLDVLSKSLVVQVAEIVWSVFTTVLASSLASSPSSPVSLIFLIFAGVGGGADGKRNGHGRHR